MKNIIASLFAVALSVMAPLSAFAAVTDATPTQQVRTNDVVATGTAGALNGAVTVAPQSMASVNIGVSGTWVGTLTFEVSIDGTNFYAVNTVPVSGGTVVQSTTANGAWTGTIPGFNSFRVRMSAYTSGTATVTIRAGAGTSGIICITGCSSGSVSITGQGTTSGSPLYTTDPSNNQIAQDSSKNQGVFIAGSGQGSSSGSPLYSTDPNITALNTDSNKNLFVVGTGSGNTLAVQHVYTVGVEMNGSAAISTTAVAISFTNAYQRIDLWNQGTTVAYCNLTATATAAMNGGILLPPNMAQPYSVYLKTAAASTLSCITQSGTTTVQGIAFR